jgi:hypothetical protein
MYKLIDGKLITLKCSNCDKSLCCVKLVRPDLKDIVWKVKATCPYCKPKKDGSPETSFTEIVEGVYYVGGHAVTNPADEEDVIMVTTIVDTKIKDEVITFIVKEYNKP